MRRASRLAIVTSLLLGLRALVGVEASAGPAARPIINGSPDTHGAVVRLNGCSGTHLGAGMILTAAHCLVDVPSPLLVEFFADTETTPRVAVVAQSFTTFQSYVGDTARDRTNDLAAVLISHCNVPSWAGAIPLLGAEQGVLTTSDVGSAVTIVGFGLTDADNPASASAGRLGGTSHIAAVEAGHTRVEGSGNQTRACNGDSGGPMLLTRGGVEYVAGVLSQGDTECASWDDYTRVDTQRNAEFIGTISAAALVGLAASCGDEPPPCQNCDLSREPASAAPFLVAFALLLRGRRPRTRRT